MHRRSEAASGAQFITMSGVAAVPPLFGGIVVATGGYEWPFLFVAVGMAAAAVHHRAVFR